MKTLLMRRKRGFTVVEMVVVVGIIGLLTSVVLFAVSQARENARDKTRISDIKQLQVTFKLYEQGFDGLPSGTFDDDLIGDGAGVDADTDLLKIMPKLPKDPKGGSGFGYFYDNDFDCTAANQTVLYVSKFETLTDSANADAVCGTDTSDDADSGMYVILLKG